MPAVAVASARGCCSAALRRCGAPAARAALPAARLLQPLASRALRTCAPPRRRALPALRARSEGGKGEGDDVDFVESKLRAVAPLVDAAASLVPENVPRPIAKTGVVLIGTSLTLWAIKSLLSTAFSLAALLLLAFVAWTITQSSESAKKAEAEYDEDQEEDPLATARRIMKKYK